MLVVASLKTFSSLIFAAKCWKTHGSGNSKQGFSSVNHQQDWAKVNASCQLTGDPSELFKSTKFDGSVVAYLRWACLVISFVIVTLLQ